MSTDRSRRGLMDDDASSLLSLDPCAVLGVRPDATARELRRAYRRALLAVHPDQGGSREALDLVRSAYDRLRRTAGPDGSTTTPAPTRDLAPRRPASATDRPVVAAPSTGSQDTPDHALTVLDHDEPLGAAITTGAEAAPTPVPTMTAAGARAAARFVTAQRFTTASEPATSARPRRRVSGRTRNRFEQLLERELVRRSDRRVRLVGATDHTGGRA